MTAATAVMAALARRKQPHDQTARLLSNLTQRIVSALVLAAIVLAATWAGGAWFALVWLAAAAAVLHEFLMLSGQGAHGPVRLSAWVFFALTAAAILFSAPQNVVLALIAAGALAFAFGLRKPGSSALSGLGFVYALLPAYAMTRLRLDGLFPVIFLFAAVWATDIFAYFNGRSLGGPKLAPTVSPSKTWSGAVGGAAGAMAAGLAIGLSAGLSGGLGLPLACLLLSVVSQLGDLGESAFKRHFGAKDSGRLIPGHGGMMDRIDGLAVAAVALWLLSASGSLALLAP